MVEEDSIVELNSRFPIKRSCFSKSLILISFPLMIYLVVIMSFLGMIPLKMELHSVILIGIIFLIYLFFMRHNAFKASCIFRKQFLKLKENLKVFIEKHKVTIQESTKANASIDDFLEEFTRDLRDTNFSSVAAGIFPTLGILGTFISIALSMPDFSSKTSAVLEQEISLLLGGVGTAFYVSIYGIFLSIWWIFFEKIGMSKFDHDTNLIKESTSSLFWNKIEIDKIHFQKSIDNFEQLNQIFKNTSFDQLYEKQQETLNAKFEMLQNLIDQEQAMIEKSSAFHDKKQLQQEKILNSYESIIGQIHALVPVLDETLKNTNFLTKHFNKKEIQIDKISQELNENISQLNETLSHLSAQNIEKVYVHIVQSLETMKQEIKNVEEGFETHLNDYESNLEEKLKNSLEMIDKQTTDIMSKLTQLK